MKTKKKNETRLNLKKQFIKEIIQTSILALLALFTIIICSNLFGFKGFFTSLIITGILFMCYEIYAWYQVIHSAQNAYDDYIQIEREKTDALNEIAKSIKNQKN